MDKTIKIGSTVFEQHPSSLAVHRGTLFLNHEERRCVRSNTPENLKFLSSQAYKEKEGVFWPKVEQIDNSFCEIEYFDHIIYWTEMTNSQIKDCMVFLCDILYYLNSNGWTAETHLWNVTLKNGKPILLDIGDFIPLSGYGKVLQKASLTSMLRLEKSDHTPKTMDSWLRDCDRVLSYILSMDFDTPYTDYLPKIKETFLSAEPISQTNYWDNYNKDQYLSEGQILASIENEKDNPICSYIKENKPSTMVDLGCNSGRLSLYAALQGARCVGLDNAAKTINEANNSAASLDLACSFVYLDLFESDVTLGLRESPHERFKGDMVIAPAVIHHMFPLEKNIKKCIDIICGYAHKNVAIEFIPHTDPHINKPLHSWFSTEDIIETIKSNGFTIEDIVNSNDERKWIFANKK